MVLTLRSGGLMICGAGSRENLVSADAFCSGIEGRHIMIDTIGDFH